MKNKTLNLFIDESGAANPNVTSSQCYVLCGILATSDISQSLKILSDQIKSSSLLQKGSRD